MRNEALFGRLASRLLEIETTVFLRAERGRRRKTGVRETRGITFKVLDSFYFMKAVCRDERGERPLK